MEPPLAALHQRSSSKQYLGENLRLFNDATSPFGRTVMMAVLSRQIALAEEFVDLQQLDRLPPHEPAQQQSCEFITRLEQRIRRCLMELEELERDPAAADTPPADDIASIAALRCGDFRYSNEWRSTCPRLSAWYAAKAEPALARARHPARPTPGALH